MTNFLNAPHKEEARTEVRFGLIDKEEEGLAKSTAKNTEDWIAEVKNSEELEVYFTAVDKKIVVFKEGTEDDKESSCDGLLQSPDSFILVELKDRAPNKRNADIKKGKKQLRNTIKLIKANHKEEEISALPKLKIAHISNKQRRTPITLITASKEFLHETGFQLVVDRKIKIKK